MAQHCAVSKCSNGKYKILRWAQELCDIHKCKKGDKGYSCDIGFKLFPFPAVKKNKHLSDQWKKTQKKDSFGDPLRTREFVRAMLKMENQLSRILSNLLILGMMLIENLIS